MVAAVGYVIALLVLALEVGWKFRSKQNQVDVDLVHKICIKPSSTLHEN